MGESIFDSLNGRCAALQEKEEGCNREQRQHAGDSRDGLRDGCIGNQLYHQRQCNSSGNADEQFHKTKECVNVLRCNTVAEKRRTLDNLPTKHGKRRKCQTEEQHQGDKFVFGDAGFFGGTSKVCSDGETDGERQVRSHCIKGCSSCAHMLTVAQLELSTLHSTGFVLSYMPAALFHRGYKARSKDYPWRLCIRCKHKTKRCSICNTFLNTPHYKVLCQTFFVVPYVAVVVATLRHINECAQPTPNVSSYRNVAWHVKCTQSNIVKHFQQSVYRSDTTWNDLIEGVDVIPEQLKILANIATPNDCSLSKYACIINKHSHALRKHIGADRQRKCIGLCCALVLCLQVVHQLSITLRPEAIQEALEHIHAHTQKGVVDQRELDAIQRARELVGKSNYTTRLNTIQPLYRRTSIHIMAIMHAFWPSEDFLGTQLYDYILELVFTPSISLGNVMLPTYTSRGSSLVTEDVTCLSTSACGDLYAARC